MSRYECLVALLYKNTTEQLCDAKFHTLIASIGYTCDLTQPGELEIADIWNNNVINVETN